MSKYNIYFNILLKLNCTQLNINRKFYCIFCYFYKYKLNKKKIQNMRTKQLWIQGLGAYVEDLKKIGELIEIHDFVDPVLEITEVTDRMCKEKNGGKAILFTNTGTDYPVLTNFMGSDVRIAKTLHSGSIEESKQKIQHIFDLLMKKPVGILQKISILKELASLARLSPKITKHKAPCQEVVYKNPNLFSLPILQCWPNDGGKFITLPLVHTKHPITGVRNTGMYRMQVFDSTTTGMHWHRHKGGAAHYEEYKKLNRKMPIAVALGGDPISTYAATAPLPEGIDEYVFAGFLRKEPYSMVKCITQDIEVPASADIIIEGYIDPLEELIWEGPFGDHTGFYSLPGWYPKFHVTCITKRKNAIYPATVVGVPPQEDYYIAKATEALFLPLLTNTIAPEIKNLHLPSAGVGHNICFLNLTKKFPGHALKISHAMFGAGQMMFNKFLFIFDKDIDVTNPNSVLFAINKNVQIPHDIYRTRGPLDILDHSTDRQGFGGKLAIDATNKFEEEIFDAPLLNEPLYEIIIENIPGLTKHIEFTEQLNFPAVVLFVEHKTIERKINLIEAIKENVKGFKYILILSSRHKDLDPYHIIWIASNNINPDKDLYFANNQLILDATEKSFSVDGFNAKWPEPVCSNIETIEKIDSKIEAWFSFNYKIDSPSLKFL